MLCAGGKLIADYLSGFRLHQFNCRFGSTDDIIINGADIDLYICHIFIRLDTDVAGFNNGVAFYHRHIGVTQANTVTRTVDSGDLITVDRINPALRIGRAGIKIANANTIEHRRLNHVVTNRNTA